MQAIKISFEYGGRRANIAEHKQMSRPISRCQAHCMSEHLVCPILPYVELIKKALADHKYQEYD